jgi:hypothetical protein
MAVKPLILRQRSGSWAVAREDRSREWPSGRECAWRVITCAACCLDILGGIGQRDLELHEVRHHLVHLEQHNNR